MCSRSRRSYANIGCHIDRSRTNHSQLHFVRMNMLIRRRTFALAILLAYSGNGKFIKHEGLLSVASSYRLYIGYDAVITSAKGGMFSFCWFVCLAVKC